MLEWLAAYGMFLFKVITIVVGILVTVAGVIALSSRQAKSENGSITVKNMNKHFDELYDQLQRDLLDKDELKKAIKLKAKKDKLEKKEKNNAYKKSKSKDEVEEQTKKIFVIDFNGDIKASQTAGLAKKIDGILTIAQAKDEVVLRLESPGGVVHGYGLAASQLKRIPENNLLLTVCVDKVAASGGYMMACVANKIIAAPFAVIGSVGVVAQVPNLNRLLKKYDIDYDIYTAGEYKRTVTVLGENTEEGKRKFKEDLHQTHVLFKNMIEKNRPSINIDKIATGEIWYGQEAIDQGLIDQVGTSDDYLMKNMNSAKVFHIDFIKKEKLAEKFGIAISSTFERVLTRTMQQLDNFKSAF